MLHLQIHQLGWKHHIVVQICHDQKRSDDDKSNQISEVNTLNRSRARRLARKLSLALRALGRWRETVMTARGPSRKWCRRRTMSEIHHRADIPAVRRFCEQVTR